MGKEEIVCVTGAGGYQASWLVKLLLSKGYIVHGTVRDLSDEKNDHLKRLEKASENLHLFKANLLDYESLYAAIEGCSGVFHVATPVPLSVLENPEVEMMEPAVKGTSNVLKACSMAKVNKVVYVSSVAAVLLNPNFTKDQVIDESCWSDKELCRKLESWYCLSKTEAERQAMEYSTMTGLNVVSVCPTLILGPMLQPTLNASSQFLIKIIRDGLETLGGKFHMYVDVRDVAEALLLVYEKPAAEGRYICSSYTLAMQDLVNRLMIMYPNYNYPTEIPEADEKINLSSEKLKKLGWKSRPFEETLADSVEDYKQKGILTK